MSSKLNSKFKIFERLHPGKDVRDFELVYCQTCDRLIGRGILSLAPYFTICCEECAEEISIAERARDQEWIK